MATSWYSALFSIYREKLNSSIAPRVNYVRIMESSVLLRKLVCGTLVLSALLLNTGLCCTDGKVAVGSYCTEWWVILLVALGVVVVIVVGFIFICCCCPCIVCSCIKDIFCCCCRD